VSNSVPAPLRIALADDHPVFRIGLRAILVRDPKVQILYEASSAAELTGWLKDHRCDLVITDFMMPGDHQCDGLKLIEYLRRHWPGVPLMVVTMLTQRRLLQAILDLGVNGLVSKLGVVDELPEAIGQVFRGRTFVSSAFRACLEDASQPVDVDSALSSRELEVARLLASGMSVGSIARRLCRSKQTISSQKLSAMRKLGVENDADLLIQLKAQGFS